MAWRGIRAAVPLCRYGCGASYRQNIRMDFLFCRHFII
jgi:hypothetical protein